MPYYQDFSAISIDSYKSKLKSSELLPGRRILKEQIDERFEYLKSTGIWNLLELQKALKNRKKYDELAKANSLNPEYLTILLREINSIHPKPNKIKDFPGISAETIKRLEKIGITDTLKLYDKVKSTGNRKELAAHTGISNTEILELTILTDLSRIKWTGVTFARMLYETGIRSVQQAAKSDYIDLHKRINELNKERMFFKGQIGLNDVKLFVDAANEVPLDIEY
jgi:hypothetical protein